MFIVVMNSSVVATADLPWVAPTATATVRTTVSACSAAFVTTAQCYQQLLQVRCVSVFRCVYVV